MSVAFAFEPLRTYALAPVRFGERRPPEIPIETTALRLLAVDLTGAPDDCWRFMASLFNSDVVFTVPQLRCFDGIHTSTVLSRFWRAGLPTPKQYLDQALLIRFAGLRRRKPDVPVTKIALELGASASTMMCRKARRITGQTASKWVQTADVDALLEQFRAELVRPYLVQLREFQPCAPARALSL